ncbi:MAG TPA: YfcE family phosphodiesterase [Firmicutes bacterium]|nr:YfcE family phosphodiesterase [Bacillota bacterium]
MKAKHKLTTVNITNPASQVGVVSDTHVPVRARFLPPELLKRLTGVDLIIHAGDLVEERVLVELEAIAPVVAVAGNMDPGSLWGLGRRKLIQAGEVLIGLLHGDGDRAAAVQKARASFPGYNPRVIVFGHTHRPYNQHREGVLMFNPGSPVDPRGAAGPSCGLLTINGSRVTGEIIYFNRASSYT